MRILIIFIFLVSNSFANEVSGIKNLVISEEFKKHGDITFFDTKKNLINLNDYKGSLIILNFWATWCAPCKEEMPSLDFLAVNENLDNLKIFPINVGKDKIENAEKFFNDLNIKIEKGNMKDLLNWLRDKIHVHGERYDAKVLCQKITGEELNFRFFMDYAKEKYSNIYKLN